MDVQTDLFGIVSRQQAKLCYFGTNWDPRARSLFRSLGARSYFRVYGPSGAWDYLEGESYCGSVPFDGRAVQLEYARYGCGLVVLSKSHALDDVISNRIFEIASVGALAICPDIPWIRKHFGDSVLYYDPFQTGLRIARTIDRLMDEVANNPALMEEKALRARGIFEKLFSAEVMIRSAVDYFEEWKRNSPKKTDPADDPLIDVIVRIGGRPLATVLRAINSIDGQTAGRFRIVFVRYKPIDLTEILAETWTRIVGFEVIDVPGGQRAATMTAGLKAASSELFAVLDDDDFWLDDHIRGLLAAAEECAPGRVYAYSGYLVVEEGADGADPSVERRTIGKMQAASGDLTKIGDGFAPHSWIASTRLLRFLPLDGWTLATAEDSVVQASLMSRADCVFNYRATACSVRGSEGSSDWATSATRAEDVFEYYTRLYSSIDNIQRKFSAPAMSSWATLNEGLKKVLEQRDNLSSTLVINAGDRVSLHERDDFNLREVPLSVDSVEMWGTSVIEPFDDEPALIVRSSEEAWIYGATVRLPEGALPIGTHVVIEIASNREPMGIGLLNFTGTHVTQDLTIPARATPVEIWLAIGDRHASTSVVLRNLATAHLSETIVTKVWIATPVAGLLEGQRPGELCLDQEAEPEVTAPAEGVTEEGAGEACEGASRKLPDCSAGDDQDAPSPVDGMPSRIDLLPRMSYAPWAVVREGRVEVSAGSPYGHALYGPYLDIDPGAYELVLRLETKFAEDGPVAEVEAVIDADIVLARRSITADEARLEPVKLAFERGADSRGALLEVRLLHLGRADLAITGAELKLVQPHQ